MTRKEEEVLDIWEHSPGVIKVLTSYGMGAWLHRRDKRVINDILNKIKGEIKKLSNANPSYWHSGDMVDRDEVLEIIDKYRAESEDKK